MIYHYFSCELLDLNINHYKENSKNNRFTIGLPKYGDFGFEAKFDYSGLMAKRNKTAWKEKEGFFDFKILAGSWFANRGVTHRDMLELVCRFSTEENCREVWRGVHPEGLARSDEEEAALLILALGFFEQEVNWGREKWQCKTNFEPDISNPKKVRPRDMLMGYISQAFEKGVPNIAYWNPDKPKTTTFAAPDGSSTRYKDYQYKGYFTSLQNDIRAEALMVGHIRDDFNRVADMCDKNNPRYKRGVNG